MTETTQCKNYFIVQNARGLHTRPSTEIVKCLGKYRSKVALKHRSNQVDGRSIMGILMLAAAKGSRIEVSAEGVDAEAAVQALLKLAEDQFYMSY